MDRNTRKRFSTMTLGLNVFKLNIQRGTDFLVTILQNPIHRIGYFTLKARY
jgi:hypothetical protein